MLYLLPNTDVDPPRVDYFYPDGVFKSTPGETTEILSVTVGTQPLHVTWQHNGSRVVNNTTLNNTHFSLTELIYSEMIFSKLTIDSVGEIAQGVYKMIANNGGGQAESGEAQLMLGESISSSCPYIHTNVAATEPHLVSCLSEAVVHHFIG
jgi:hypothetical protein